jgi:hypothetical protein
MGTGSISRRSFLGAAGAVAAVGAAAAASGLAGCGGGTGLVPSAASSRGLPAAQDVAELKLAHFDPCVGERFSIWHRDHGLGEIVLVKVQNHSAMMSGPPALGARTPFSLQFEGAEDACPEEGIYVLEHPGRPEFGMHELHVMRLPRENGRGRFDIHFN